MGEFFKPVIFNLHGAASHCDNYICMDQSQRKLWNTCIHNV